MNNRVFNVDKRFLTFWYNCRNYNWLNRYFLVFSIGWIISLIVLLTQDQPGPSGSSIPNFLVFDAYPLATLFLFGFFWFQLSHRINNDLAPPIELLLVVCVLIAMAIHSITLATTNQPEVITPSWFANFFIYLLLALMLLFLGLLLTSGSKGKGGILAQFIIFGYFFIEFALEQRVYLLLVMKFILIISILQRTNWLETLSKVECWIYLFVALFMFRMLFIIDDYSAIAYSQFEHSLIWYGLPYYIHFIVMTYFLAMAIKIPIVLVYNHARLPRKLWIASLFQSTFPQVFQLITLLLVFHFFLASWQADQVRQAINYVLEEVKEGTIPQGMTGYSFSLAQLRQGVRIDEFNLRIPPGDVADSGVIRLEKQPRWQLGFNEKPDFYLFTRASEFGKEMVYFVKMDKPFLQHIANAFIPVLGSDLQVYPLTPNRWENYFYSADFFQKGQHIRAFPFGLLPHSGEIVQQIAFKNQTQRESWGFFDFILPWQWSWLQSRLVVGRLLIDFHDAFLEPEGYFAYDIILRPYAAIFSSVVLGSLSILLLIYFLINALIIRRVVKVGAEINQMIVQKFQQLQHGIREIASGNLDFKVKVEGQDEFVELASHFNTMGERLKETIAEAREKGRLEHELQIAREVQKSLLPQKLPQIPDYEIVSRSEMANEVGGDFFDFIRLNDDQYLFTIGDVSGKGTSAAFYMAQCVSLLRFSLQFTSNVNDIALRLNHYFSDPEIDKQMFITAIIGTLCTKTHKVTLIRAGHTQPVFIPGDKNLPINEIECRGVGIGLSRNGNQYKKLLQSVELQMLPGDSLFLYTDGIVEAQIEKETRKSESEKEIELFDETRLLRILTESRQSTLHKATENIILQLNRFYDNAPLTDDYTLLAFRRKV